MALQSAQSLNHDDTSLPLIISIGASATHAGAVLEQEHKFDGNIKPITQEFYSKVFPFTTQVRSTFHRELRKDWKRLERKQYVQVF